MKTSKSKLLFQTGGYTPTQLTDPGFVPTYVGTPLEDAQKYGTDLLNTYKTNISDLTKLDIANAQRKVNPGDVAESAKYDAELKAQFEDMAKTGDYENMTHQVNELARRHFNNKDIKLMGENYAEGEKAQAHAQALKDKGLAPLFFNDPNKHQTVTYDENGKKNLNKYTYTGEAPLDYQAQKAKIWSVIQPDMAPLSESPDDVNKTLQALPGYLATGEWKGISGGPDGKIAQLLKFAETSYKQTPEYQQELKKELVENPGMTQQDAEKVIRERVVAEGMLKTFSQKGVQMYQNWMLKKQMEDGEVSNLVPDLETGVKFKDMPQFKDLKLDSFNPRVSTSLDEMRKKGDSPRYGGNPEDYAQFEKPNYQRGTPEQRTTYENIAKAVVQKDYPEDTLNKYYTGDVAKNTEDEKKFLYSPEVYDKVKEYTKNVENKLFFSTIQGYDNTPKAQQQQKAATAALHNDFGRKVFYDFATGKVVSPEDQGRLNPEFENLVPDVSKLEVTGHTAGINPYGKLANDPRFYNSEIAMYYDPKEKQFRKFLVADNVYKSDPNLQTLSDLWATGISQPYQTVKHRTLSGKDVEFKDEEGKGIRIFKVNGHELKGKDGKLGIVVDNYEDFLNGLNQLN